MQDLIIQLIESNNKTPDEYILSEQTRIAQKIFDESTNSNNGKLFLLIAPPGFGKTETFIAPYLYSILNNEWIAGRSFIIDPIHSLLKQIKERIENYVKNIGVNVSIDEDHGEVINKAFLYNSIITLTTIDSFTYGYLAKRVFTWINRDVKTGRYSLPAGLIMNSYNVFDEAHLIQDEAYLGPRILSKIINPIVKSGGLVLFSTATIPSSLINLFNQNNIIDFVVRLNRTKEVQINLHNDTIENIKKYINLKDDCNNKTLIFTNTIERAQMVYNILKDDCNNIALLHSLFRKIDRDQIFDQVIKNNKLLIATQAGEVGIDIDSFEKIFTEISPIDSLIQRFGRVRRNKIEAHVFDVKNSSPYLDELIKNTKNILNNENKLDLNDINDIQNKIDMVYNSQVINHLSSLGNSLYAESAEYIYNLHLYSYPPEQSLYLRPSFYVTLYVIDDKKLCEYLLNSNITKQNILLSSINNYQIKYSISLVSPTGYNRLINLLDQSRVLCYYKNGKIIKPKKENDKKSKNKLNPISLSVIILNDGIYNSNIGINTEMLKGNKSKRSKKR